MESIPYCSLHRSLQIDVPFFEQKKVINYEDNMVAIVEFHSVLGEIQ